MKPTTPQPTPPAPAAPVSQHLTREQVAQCIAIVDGPNGGEWSWNEARAHVLAGGK